MTFGRFKRTLGAAVLLATFVWPAFSATPAAANRSLIGIDGLYLLGFGPRSPDAARDLMADASFGLVILDELNIALRYDYLELAAVVAALGARRPSLHVVVTGRNAKPELLAAADLVTEMTLVKHHFAAGVKAQPGIEF